MSPVMKFRNVSGRYRALRAFPLQGLSERFASQSIVHTLQHERYQSSTSVASQVTSYTPKSDNTYQSIRSFSSTTISRPRNQHAFQRPFTSIGKPDPYATSSPSNDPHSHPHSFRIYHDSIPALRTYRSQLFLQSQSVGFVATMGALHSGHLSLIRAAAAQHPHVFVSIFVNPTQFGPKEDLSTYPRTWEQDLEKLETLNKELSLPNSTGGRISLLFAPSTKTIYPTQESGLTVLPPPSLSATLEGASRPSFLPGVATICTKLFSLLQPTAVYFGAKDIQQSVLIRRLVRDLHIPTVVSVVRTSREAGDGLAMSSRNVHLGKRRRGVAGVLYRALRMGEEVYRAGREDARGILEAAKKELEDELARQNALSRADRSLFEVDYVSLTDLEDMDSITGPGPVGKEKGAVLSLAVKMLPVEEPQDEQEKRQGVVRLIDNVVLEEGRS
ncbi:MAG: hypothetical protein Q9160_000626 [Pyrenula sp. 1 TL-2023]